MELLRGLGVNLTAVIQFAIFLVSYLILYFVLFKPYFKAYQMRVDRTMGQTEEAERFLAETLQLENEYQQKAREISDQYRAIYDQNRLEATKEYDRLIGAARQSAREKLDTAKAKITAEVTSAQTEVMKEVPAVAAVISKQLLGKEVAQ